MTVHTAIRAVIYEIFGRWQKVISQGGMSQTLTEIMASYISSKSNVNNDNWGFTRPFSNAPMRFIGAKPDCCIRIDPVQSYFS
jgi:hypothetical protein